MGKSKRSRKTGPTRRRDGTVRPLLESFPGARNWDDVADLIDTLHVLLGHRNRVLAELAPHLTDDHRAMLGWPPDRLDPAAAARARARGAPE